MGQLSDTDAAWLAGLFEGEGSLVINRKSSGSAMVIRMSDADIIERVQVLVPGQSVKPVAGKERRRDGSFRKTMYTWQIGRAAMIRDLLSQLMPWFGDRRREQAEAMLAYLDTKYPHAGAYWATRTTCLAGHEYNAENTRYYVRDGSPRRDCLICKRLNTARRRAGFPKLPRAQRVEIVCVGCDQRFTVSQSRQRRFCSVDCYRQSRRTTSSEG